MGRWWGYIHVNGSIQAKPASWDVQQRLDEAQDSPMVRRVIEPFDAIDRDDAISKIRRQFGAST
jgi:hypothetical protein